jgi:hypothetical protein
MSGEFHEAIRGIYQMAARFKAGGSLRPGDLLEARLSEWRTAQYSKVFGGLFGLDSTAAPHLVADAETSAR